MKLTRHKIFNQQGFIPVLIAIIAGAIVVGIGVVATNRNLRSKISDYFWSKPISISELRGKLTPEIRQCIIDKLGKEEARKLLEEAKQTKTLSSQAQSVLKLCLGGGPAGPMPPVSKNSSANPTQSPIVPSSGIALGVYESPINYNYSNPLSYGAALDQYKNEVGKYPAYAWASVKWKDGKTGQYNQFDPTVKPVLDQYRNRGIMPAFNWDPSEGEGLKHTNQPDFSWKAIASGKQDTYITQFAKDAAVYHYPFLIRPFAEMDGNYYPWGYSVNGNTNTADFVAAWKHVVDIFRKQGATNVQFVWCQRANDSNTINKGNNRDLLKQLYPGDDYVDFIALDGYASSGNNWRSLRDEFQPMYQLQTSFSTRPMIFFEIGATENPNDPMTKANWITQGFLTAIPGQFPAVRAVSWMDAPNNIINPGNKENDWRLNTSTNSLDAWKTVVASPLYQGSLLK